MVPFFCQGWGGGNVFQRWAAALLGSSVGSVALLVFLAAAWAAWQSAARQMSHMANWAVSLTVCLFDFPSRAPASCSSRRLIPKGAGCEDPVRNGILVDERKVEAERRHFREDRISAYGRNLEEFLTLTFRGSTPFHPGLIISWFFGWVSQKRRTPLCI